ncbi:amidohydrolase [Pararcticibacter amylolyticus]|uniref:Amidohydrolase n=1 Tax=Pararcticibacter amylolyticus TaxID=2173175 RepID=A0A2U2PAF4_9SPHI|nr:amidohydrolase [Pararcticibacter amylolyticus]PWG78378.1 amidohydrolase [Pararcticibacter amylolyticus]
MNKTIWLIAPAALLLLCVSFRKVKHEDNQEAADRIYINGHVITMDPSHPEAEALAVKDGRIIAVGSSGSIGQMKGPQTVVTDLEGKALVPGFIDGHSHFMSLGRSKTADLSPPPVGEVTSIPGLVNALKKFQKEKNIKAGVWITGRGYDPDQLAEGRHPVKEDLDAAFPDNPVLITHTSGHMSVANSYALRISGVNASTKDPEGGKIVRKAGSNEPTGLLLERARSVLKTGEGEKLSLDEQLKLLDEQQALYASQGITTAQDGSSSLASVVLLKEAARRKRLYIDIESLPSYAILDRILTDSQYVFNKLQNHLKLKGTKIFTDGSPQGKTAFFSKPYLTEVPGCSDHCTGIPTITQEKLNEALIYCFKHKIQVYTHCNGDASIDMYIQAVRNANTKFPGYSRELRPVVIHSQFVRADQLDSYRELGMIPSFFTNHAFFWGDVHVRNLGKERAWFLSPAKTALEKGVLFTNHTDFGVTPINQLFLLWTSVTRESRSGQVIGPDQRLTVTEGLRAITLNGAWQYSEEKEKGSIEKGKLADLVILSDNPLTVPAGRIKDITVLETVKEGKTIFKHQQ